MSLIDEFLNGRVSLHCGDCRDVLATLAENSLDACVTDAPYHLTSIVQRFGAEDAAPPKFKSGAYGGGFKEENGGTGAAFARMSRGFMGKVWDGGDIAFRPETWAAVYRVLKPGAYIVAFGSSRNYHRMACAIEDAGFITHPMIGWITGQGFPKAHSVSKHIDRMAGAEREITGQDKYAPRRPNGRAGNQVYGSDERIEWTTTAPSTDAAKQWDGWFYGSQSLKPALEPIYVGQKPFEKGLNGTENILKWGTGAINVDGCRVGTDVIETCNTPGVDKFANMYSGSLVPKTGNTSHVGRWPANVVLSVPEDEYELKPFTTSEEKRELFRWLSENA